MKQANYLKAAAQTVGFLFTAFGGFLTKAAPPDDAGGGFAIGLGSFFALAILLLVRALAGKATAGRHRGLWITVGAACLLFAIFSGLRYADDWSNKTFEYPPDRPEARYCVGSSRQPAAIPYFERGLSASEVVAKFGGPRSVERIWTVDSLDHVRATLRREYIVLALSLAASLFSLLELVLPRK